MNMPCYLAGAILALNLLTSDARAQSFKPVTPAEWIEDIDYFAAQLVKKHKNAFHYTTREKFDKAISDLKNDVPRLQDHQVIIRLQQITSSIGDGHTGVHLPKIFKHYPITLFWFGQELYVTRATYQYKQVIGARLTKINGHSLQEIQDKLSLVVTDNENDWFFMSTSAIFITIPEILHTLGIVPDTDKASFVFTLDNNEELQLDLVPVSQGGQGAVWVPLLKEEPLFRQKINDPFWFTYLEDINAVYVNFKNYDELAQNTRKVFDLVDEKKATRLIIDMRQNGGGDFTKVRRQFIPKIQENGAINQKNHLFVITGRRTFSAAMVNAIDFKKETNAIIIGEPPGEKPNSYSENDEMKLPHSQLIISYSTRYYKFLDKDTPAFEPDIRIDPNWPDFKAGIDPVMKKIIFLINEKKDLQ